MCPCRILQGTDFRVAIGHSVCLCCGFFGRWLLTGATFSVVGAGALALSGQVVLVGHGCVGVCMGCHVGLLPAGWRRPIVLGEYAC